MLFSLAVLHMFSKASIASTVTLSSFLRFDGKRYTSCADYRLDKYIDCCIRTHAKLLTKAVEHSFLL